MCACPRWKAGTTAPNHSLDAKSKTERRCHQTCWQCVRLACDLLRDAPEPLPTSAIITDLIRLKGIPEGDVRARDLIQRTVLSTFERTRTTIERVLVGGTVCWRIRD